MERHKEARITLGTFLVSIFLVVAVTVSVTVTFDFYRFNSKFKNISKYEVVSSRLYELDEIVRNKFDGVIDEKVLNDSIRNGYVSGILDKNSRYMTAQEYAKTLKDEQGQKLLFGAELVVDGGYIKVNKVFETAISKVVDLHSGDLIVNVEGEDLTFDNVKDNLAKLGEEEGRKLSLVVRRGVEEIHKKLMTQYIEVPALQGSELAGGIGFVKISSLSKRAVKEFEEQISRYRKDKDALIFDVRGVSSGTLEAAAEILQQILPQGLIVSQFYQDGNSDNLFYCDGKKEITQPIVVLANSRTSGPAELFVQALRNYDKAEFVGDQTAGKGTVQEVFELRDGSAVELTVAKFAPPDGVNFDGIGLRPDYTVLMTPAQEQSVFTLNEMREDLQLLKACEILRSKNQ